MKLLLCILDGVGIRNEIKGNAVYKANMPNFKRLINEYPNSLLEASGNLVGLPFGQMGNSEVGHTNIGAGRIVYQPLELINSKIENKEFFNNKNILEIINHTKENNSKLHIMGLLSDGGIHSHINHLFALLDMCKKENVKEVYLHMFLDGRDTLPDVSLKYLDQLDSKIKEINLGKICTLSGRYYAMDRDNNYDRVKKAYDAIIYGKGEIYKSYKEAIKANQERNISDEFTIPCVLDEGKIDNKDGVILFNFRPDRLREIGSSLTNPKFDKFEHKNIKIKLLTMMPVSDEVLNITAYDLQTLDNTFGEYISSKGLTQLRIAETEKYAHVTYFFDGGVEKKIKGAKRILIPSPKVKTYDMKPEMSAYKITERLLKEMHKYDVIVLNFANGDMVGHTGNMDATVRSLEVVDECIGKLYNKTLELGGILVVTADHGNSDYMIDDNDNIVTSHSTSKVPFIVTKDDIKLKDGKLGDIAPTLLTLLNLPIPKEMTGDVLIDNYNKNKGNKLEKIFRIISLIFIITSIVFYISRFSYLYLNNNKKNKYKESNIIDVINNIGVSDCASSKCFKGNIENNYLLFNGIMWQIIGYEEDGVKLISNDILTSLKYKKVDQWLEKFKENLNNSYVKNVSLMTKDDYKETFDEKSFLELKTNWWLDNSLVNVNGEVLEIEDNNYGVRPVIKINNDSIIVQGDGSISNPYEIIYDEPYYLKDLYVGNYIYYSDNIWRVLSNDKDGVKVISANLLDEHVYSKTNKMFDLNETNSIAYYLNNEYYETLDNSLMVKTNWKINKYSSDNDYNFEEIVDTVNAYVGLPSVGDLFINDQYDYALLTNAENDLIYKVNPYGQLYKDLRTSSRKVRPVIKLKNDSKIISGNGLSTNPYRIGE